MFDLKTKVMVGIGSGLLIAAFVLIGIVIGLYIKVSKALRAARESAVCGTRHAAKICPGKPIPVAPCRPLPCCNDCNMCTDVDSLPPCCCSTNEGL
ncbi:protein FAM24A [Ochotona curzoniae]|uniref:protein FAM24A n=1 Tax=Ochotona curzoniae TaxID=130825 RepID=UPI001B34F517|nr:protein FAM24A [Ochotona curzoniae]